MIEILASDASADEIAAIVAALSSRARAPAGEGPPSPWALAARHPELDFDDLRALVIGR